MEKNFDVVIFRNGDTIPESKTNDEWEQADLQKTNMVYFITTANDPFLGNV
jgi:hypothetical protein